MSARLDGHGYIDEPPAVETPRTIVPASDSGSSIEEDISSSERSAVSEGEEEEEEEEEDEEWDAQGEDWDLATGDFTKQYNRMRQVQTASTSKVMLPARNQAVTGVRLNPKTASEGHERDKSDRATLEQVLDSRTRLVLTGLVNRDVIGKINRCISTGKEANVYHASPSSESISPLAVKVYRTSILAFRSRQSYMDGEHRFRGEYTSSRNPRKMVRVWAEKEMRNLRRLEQGGVRSPKAIEVKQNVLVMEYLGTGEEASPRLKDAELSIEKCQDLYVELLVSVRIMFRECKLVHADLSEYNLLYHADHIYIIDVSQSVEEDHPRAFDFLRHDINNIEAFFSKKGVKTLGSRRAWDFITGSKYVNDEGSVRELLEEPHDPIDDAVFMASFIPRSLGEVYDPERDVELVNAGRGDELIYAEMAGLDVKAEKEIIGVERKDAESDVEDQAQDDEYDAGRSRGFRHEDPEAKKERKKAVKKENREKRKTKMPKAEKLRLMKKSGRS